MSKIYENNDYKLIYDKNDRVFHYHLHKKNVGPNEKTLDGNSLICRCTVFSPSIKARFNESEIDKIEAAITENKLFGYDYVEE